MTSDFKTFSEIFPEGLKGIIYDCDGVMIDSEEANRAFYNIILHSLDLPSITREQEEYAFMATAKEALEAILPASLHSRIDELIKNNVNYNQDVLPKIRLMPGFENFIKTCNDLHILQAIDTNRTDMGINAVLEFFDIVRYFNPVISSSHTKPKPDPAGVMTICTKWHTEPSQVLFIGDSMNDRQTAKNAGAIFCAFGDKGLKGDLETASFSQLGENLFPFIKSW